MSQLRCWCFTLNNYTENDIENLENNILNTTYTIYGFETAPSTNTNHLQGYMEFENPTRMNTIKKKFKTMHLEGRKGTQKQAIEYCKKDGNFTEIGKPKKQGERNDIRDVKFDARDKGMRGVVDIHKDYNVQCIRIAEKYLTYCENKRNWKPNVTWIWGPTGTGKSRRAREILEGKDIYTKNDATKWWDGYDKHEAVIIDDFRPSWWPITELLRILDRYECKLEVKGGYRQLLCKDIVVTSAFAPNTCYLNTGESIDQLLRRIDVTIELGTDVTEVGGNTSHISDAPTFPIVQDNIIPDEFNFE